MVDHDKSLMKNVRGERQGSYGLVSLVITTLSQRQALSLGGNLLARKTERVAVMHRAHHGTCINMGECAQKRVLQRPCQKHPGVRRRHAHEVLSDLQWHRFCFRPHPVPTAPLPTSALAVSKLLFFGFSSSSSASSSCSSSPLSSSSSSSSSLRLLLRLLRAAHPWPFR